MTQRQLDHAVARTTGESLRTIRARGFGFVAATDDDPDAHDAPAPRGRGMNGLESAGRRDRDFAPNRSVSDDTAPSARSRG